MISLPPEDSMGDVQLGHELGDAADLSLPSAPDDALSPLRALVWHLRGKTAGRARLGYLCHAPQSEPNWGDIAARVGCEIAVLPQLWLARLPTGARFAAISVAGLLDALDGIAQSRGESDVAVVIGLDLLLTRLDPDECARFWDDLPHRLPHRPRALILALPQSFARLGPVGWDEKISVRLE